MKSLLTGGAGFIGRWTLEKLLQRGDEVVVIDDLSNGSMANVDSFLGHKNFNFIQGDVKDRPLLDRIFSEHQFDRIYHLAASIVVQDSIEHPRKTFENDVVGTFNLLEKAKEQMLGPHVAIRGNEFLKDPADRCKDTVFLFMSTCMVYKRGGEEGISEEHPTESASPYAGSKIAAENLTLSYYKTYGLPIVIVRPFNTYGPFQKSNGEGGVVPIFVANAMAKKPLCIYGDGTQTRDLLYVEDCADFILKAPEKKEAIGEIINAGTGKDIAIKDLALLISGDEKSIQHIPHIHPQSEIAKLKCNAQKAYRLLGWQARTSLSEGILKLKESMENMD